MRCHPPGPGLLSLAAGLALVVAHTGYTVEPGDTLSGIAAHHGVSVSELAALNDLADADYIRVGQLLSVPDPGGASPGAYTVQSGETLSGIAARHGTTVAALVALNDLADPNHIRAGQQLRLPAGATPSSAPPPARGAVEELLERTAYAYGWNPAFIKAVAWQESGWNQQVVSASGAIGIMQVLPGTGRFVSRYVVGRELDLHDPADNVEAGVAFLDYLYALTGGDTRLVLAGYYQGLRSVEQNGIYPTTERYIANVLALRERFS